MRKRSMVGAAFVGLSVYASLLVILCSFPAGAQDMSTCSECTCAGDRDGDGTVTVDEAVAVVGNLLDGCPPQLRWYRACLFTPVLDHDVCPVSTVFCTAEKLGAPCRERAARCCLPDSLCTSGNCNASLVCTDEDPTPVACRLRSRRRFKHDIEYLAPSDLERLRAKLLAMNLTRFRYKDEPSSVAPHLGFIIEDVEPSPSVDSQGDAVDLYGYISMAVGTIQVQEGEIQALRQELKALRERIDRPDDAALR
jgi:hypothetical protein